MKLHDLTLANLSALHDFLGTLRDVGTRAEKAGLSVRFDITPGCPVAMWTDFVMPDDVGSEDSDDEPDFELQPAPENLAPAAGQPPFTMPPASGPGWRTGEPWTEDEDEAIIAAAVANPDWTGGAIARAIAEPMRRTVSAMSFRINHSLRDRIKAARSQAPGAGRTAPVEAPAGDVVRDATGGAVPFYAEPAAPMQTPAQGGAAAERPAKAAVAAAADVGQPLRARSSPDAVKPAPAVVSSPAAGVLAIDQGLPAWQRQLRAIVNDLGYPAPWSAEKDLLLVEGLLKGMGITGAAEWADVEGQVALKRWTALTDPLPKDAKGRPMIEWQQRLLIELRARCDGKAEAA